MIRILSFMVVLAGLLTACGGSAAEIDPDGATTDLALAEASLKDQLLQGAWVSASDPNVTWTFASGQLTEGLKGTQVRSQSGAYTISDDCTNGDGNGAKTAEGYLNLVNPGRCFFIISLTETELSLAYVGRGNILKFRKQ